MTKITEIKNPWIIIHQPEGDDGKIRTLLAGKPEAGYEDFALIVCDLIRHIAAGFHVSENDVFEWIDKERKKPTTEIETVWERPIGMA